MMKLLTVIVPCYNEEQVLPFFYKSINKVAKEMDNKVEFEYIFVDDGSKDGTLEYIKKIALLDKKVRYVSFSKNFGKEAAMYAGFKHAKGDYVALIDADLQNPPEMIIDMYKGIVEEGYDCVATRRVTRTGEPPIRSFFAKMFYKIINRISTTDIVDGAFDYRLMTRQMIDSVLEIQENNRFTKGILAWVGFKTKWLEYENVQRAAGESKWSFISLFKYAIEGIVGFSTAPLVIASVLGTIFTGISTIFFIVQLIQYLILGHLQSNLALIVNTIVFIGGLQFWCIGILSEYMGKTYLESKHRPIYIKKEDEKNLVRGKEYLQHKI